MQSPESWNEQQLLIQLKSGEESAFGKLYAHYSEMIYGRLLRLLKDPDMADEIIQELFLKVWEKRTQVNPLQSFKSYLYTIAENLVYDHFRKVARDRKLQEKFRQITTELYTHTEEDLLIKESMESINKAISTLPPQRQTAFVLCKMEGKSYEEAAEIMGISISTVSNHLVKANITIRAYLSKSEDLLPALLIIAIIGSL
ncbi:RNA polymerase sigma factor [Pedobacter gandavensis]|uniref:RNA polymerase sigma factor n=1 Tax=Pedobacter gandavensis TaxID=2679963 RepID=UPI00292E87D9|nr:RNA polymerase sigma factor [Pedobacter gandavensis]